MAVREIFEKWEREEIKNAQFVERIQSLCTKRSPLTLSQKKMILKKIGQGKTTNDIMIKVPVSRQQINAIRAHLTMETYMNQPTPITNPIREQIRDMIYQNMSNMEIRKKFNKKYTHQQIAGIKAGMTKAGIL